MIKIKKVYKKICNREILNVTDINFPDAGIIGIFGESGSGKTTLLNILSLICNDFEGDIEFNNLSYKELIKEKNESLLRQNLIGYMHQNPFLIDNLTIEENLLLSFETDNTLIIKTKIERVLKEVGLYSKAKQLVKNLSGGEKQRVSIARCLIKNYKVVLCDEPTGNLDFRNSESFMKLIKEISSRILFIVVSHDVKKTLSYCDGYIKLKDGIVVEKSLKEEKESSINHKLGESNKLNKLFIKKYINSFFKFKKVRCLLFSIISIIAFISIGTICILKNDISSSMKSSFSKIFDSNDIVVNQNFDEKNNRIKDSCEIDIIQGIQRNFPDCVESYGNIYSNNFENIFKDTNNLSLVTSTKSIPIEGYSIRNFNEVIPPYLIEDMTYIMKRESLLADEIILSLNEKQINDMCFDLKIKRNADELFKTIKEDGVYVSLNVSNVSWGYDDQEIFQVVGFVKSNSKTIYHDDLSFSEVLFENQLHLNSTYHSEKEYEPWTLRKSHYIKLNANCSDFLVNSLSNDLLSSYCFEPINDSYLSSFEINKSYWNSCYVVYRKPSGSFNTQIIKNLEENSYENFVISSLNSYINVGSSFLSGFMNPIALSSSEELNSEIIDGYVSYKNSGSIEDSFKENIEKGIFAGILNSFGVNLRIKNQSSHSKIIGNYSSSINEVLISTAMKEKLNIDIHDFIYLGMVNVSEINTENPRIYKTKIEVCGIVESDEYELYGNSYFSILLFQELFKTKYENFIPNALILKAKENINIEKQIDLLSSSFKDYSFSSPFLNMNKNIDNTLFIIEIILTIFAIFSNVISILLIREILLSIVNEFERDVILFKIMGKENKDSLEVFDRFVIKIFLKTLISSLFFCFLISVLISITIAKQSGTAPVFSINVSLIFIFIVLAILFFLFARNSIMKSINKINFYEIMRK